MSMYMYPPCVPTEGRHLGREEFPTMPSREGVGVGEIGFRTFLQHAESDSLHTVQNFRLAFESLQRKPVSRTDD